MRLLENLVKSGKTRVDRANKERESIEKVSYIETMDGSKRLGFRAHVRLVIRYPSSSDFDPRNSRASLTSAWRN